MARKTSDPRNELIHCDSCGEDYSATYKRCPFCGDKGRKSQSSAPAEDDYVFEGGYIFDELETEEDDGAQTKGGKRLASSGHTKQNSSNRSRANDESIWERLNLSPVRIAGFVFTLVIIIAALLIVTKLILPMIDRGDAQLPDSNPGQSQSSEPSAPSESDPVESTPAESTPVESTPAEGTATALVLNKTEFTISDRYPDPVTITATLLPEGSTGTVTWTSSNPSAVTVDENGKVTAVGKGTATITASLPNGFETTCLVRSTVSSASVSEPSTSTAPSTEPSGGSLSLSREDFTLNDTWPTYTFTVTGASGSVTWSTSDSSVASIDANGKVTKVGSGKCTITATDSAGNTATCIVRCG